MVKRRAPWRPEKRPKRRKGRGQCRDPPEAVLAVLPRNTAWSTPHPRDSRAALRHSSGAIAHNNSSTIVLHQHNSNSHSRWQSDRHNSLRSTRLFDSQCEKWSLVIHVWFTCIMLSGYFPWKVTIDSNLCDTLGYGWGLFAVYKRRSDTPLRSYEVIVMLNYDYLVVKINDTKNGWLSYHACLA
jgi:hypothetical protein